MDFFNRFNYTIFNDPGDAYNAMSLLDSPNFGVITDQAGSPQNGDFAGPRRVQAGLRVEF